MGPARCAASHCAHDDADGGDDAGNGTNKPTQEHNEQIKSDTNKQRRGEQLAQRVRQHTHSAPHRGTSAAARSQRTPHRSGACAAQRLLLIQHAENSTDTICAACDRRSFVCSLSCADAAVLFPRLPPCLLHATSAH